MLNSAVQHSKSAQPPKPAKPLAQQIFSSSPTAQSNPSVWSGFKRAGSNGEMPLKAVSPSRVNGSARQPGQSAYTNPLKRASSSISTGSNGSAMSRNFSSQQRHQAVPAALPRADSGVLNKLHQDAMWDENDFDEFPDDAEVTFDDPIPEPRIAKAAKTEVSYPSLRPTHRPDEPSYPTLPTIPPQTPNTRTSQSTALPWSSSPPLHVKPNFEQFRNRPAPHAASKQPPQPEVIDLEAESLVQEQERPVKRRTLPWVKDGPSVSAPSATFGSKRMQRAKKEPGPPTHTPAAKVHKDDLWDASASAVKAEQKKFRESIAEAARKQTQIHVAVDSPHSNKVKTSKKAAAPVFLSDEQRRVLDLVVSSGKSVFFTGSAGTGKSVLMREIIHALKKKYMKEVDRVAVTASTGLAACNIGGNTLHSFSGVGLGQDPADVLVKKVKKNQKHVQRWQRTKVLIIDEISMIDGTFFDKLEAVARAIRRKAAPFGGIQLVITGDFFQLPPVGDKDKAAKFAFDAATWNTCIDHTIGLTHIFRQKDPVFAGMLNEMRVGKLTPKSIAAFNKLARPLICKDTNAEVEATELFPTRNEVERANGTRLLRLGGNTVDFPALDGGTIAEGQQRDKLLANCMAAPMITLKKGAQVMLIKNIDDTLVNGSIGKVVGFMDEKTFDYYDEHEEEFLSTNPTMDANSHTAAPGKGANLKGYLSNGPGQRWPVVRFLLQDGTSRDLLCQRETWKIEQPNGEVLASRSQIPLILAWALSIHKAQGQTLEKVKVDLGKVFEKGQAYVALSRATTQDGLQVTRFNPSKVQAHERVRKFYDSLYSINDVAGTSLSLPTKQDRVKTDMYGTDFPYAADEDDSMHQMM